MTVLRLAVATVAVGAAVVALQITGASRSMGALYALLAATYASTGALYAAHRAGAPDRALLAATLAVDCAVITVLMHHTGGSASPFATLYLLPILCGGIFFQVSGGLATAALSAALCVAYGILEMRGFVSAPPAAFAAPGGHGAAILVRGYLSASIFVLTGLLSGSLAKYLREREEELRRVSDELTRVRMHAASIITNVSSGLIVTNMAGEIDVCNPAAVRILGLRPDEDLTGRLIQDVIPHMSALVREIEGVLATGAPRRRHELGVRRKDGIELPLGISISLLRAEGGERRGVIAIFQDLTEVHVMREKVRRADKMAAIGELSTAIAHEIRAPLASICGSIEMLAGELELSGDNRNLMDLVLKESDRLDRIITDFLEFARLRKPAFEPVDVEQCLREVLMLLRHSSGFDARVAVELSSNAPHACVYADDEQLRQVFLNLIMNAREAMPDGGRLGMRIDRVMRSLREGGCAEECVSIDFENDGPAIPEDVIPHVFEPFYTTKEGGTGLGLAIVARIVESHAGHVRVESAGDRGVRFSVALPLGAAAREGRQEIQQEEFISF